jgi:hypothetical protein
VKTGFEFGAEVLRINIDALLHIYDTTLEVMREGMAVGKLQTAQGLLHTLNYYDLLHGGAYAAPINARPWYLKNPSQSPYYAGSLQNLIDQTWVSWLAQNTAGTSATQMANEIFTDANVPHVFPKLISDESYAFTRILFAQAATTDLFQKSASGFTTLVEGVGRAVHNVQPRRASGRSPPPEDEEEEPAQLFSEDEVQQLRGLITQAATMPT